MSETQKNTDPDRRDVIKSAGKIGLVVPPAMAFLLSTSMRSEAIAHSSHHGRGHHHGYGHHGRGGSG